jgi:hypothetical protein
MNRMTKVLERMLREVDALPAAERQRILGMIEAELSKIRRENAISRGRWAELVARMRREAPLAGESEAVLERARGFRDHLDLRIKPFRR